MELYNTAVGKKQPFDPMVPGKLGIYVCGVTVYDLCHIGHARSAIVFDVLVRYFRARGFDVTYVRNFTDVDDKIIARAEQLGKPTTELAQENIDAFYEDMGALGVQDADLEPRATEHIEGMIRMISTLVERGYAYEEGGDVFFAVQNFKSYGALSGRRLEDMQAGSRIAVDDKKRHPMDFVLWKAAKPGEPQWDSPWGKGRPGWHIECSVMSNAYLGPTFDIHGGGKDLLFPHHENERAQSVAATDGEFARYWVHNGFVTVESEKMSKSLGNFLTIRDALNLYHPEVLRLFLLSKHYRHPLDFSKSAVEALQAGYVRMVRTLERLETVLGPPEDMDALPAAFLSDQESAVAPLLKGDFIASFIRFMEDDLNTAGAIGLLFEQTRELNRALDEGRLEDLAVERQRLLMTARVLGLLERTPAQFFEELGREKENVNADEIDALVARRAEARAKKDWGEADRIRDQLKDMGVILEDGPQGTTWRLDV